MEVRLREIHDKTFLHLVESSGVNFSPFHNGRESLTYWNVMYKYTHLEEKCVGVDSLIHTVQVQYVVDDELWRAWFVHALGHAKQGFVRDLIDHHGFVQPLLEATCTIFLKLRLELEQYVTTDTSKQKRNATAHPFGTIIRTTFKVSLSFSWYSQKSTVTSNISQVLSKAKKMEFLTCCSISNWKRTFPMIFNNSQWLWHCRLLFLVQL